MTNVYLWWVVVVAAVWPGAAMMLVMLGQPVRPFGHLVKATTFWSVVIWVALAVILGGVL